MAVGVSLPQYRRVIIPIQLFEEIERRAQRWGISYQVYLDHLLLVILRDDKPRRRKNSLCPC